MPEGQVVHKTETPVTVESLQADFEVLGIEKGMTLLVHSSLSAMGWVLVAVPLLSSLRFRKYWGKREHL